MDREHLIIIKGEDKTKQVKSIRYNDATQTYDIYFQNNDICYSHATRSVKILSDPQAIDPEAVEITHRGHRLFSIESIQLFHCTDEDGFLHISFGNGSERTYRVRDIELTVSCLVEQRSTEVISYLRELSHVNDLKSEDGKLLLAEQYNKLKFVGEDTALALYLNPEMHPIRHREANDLIFPFGGNASQFQALENALCNQISVIQGPPGTGKTQTILNIIANLLVAGKTVQIVSSNNSATENVLEKLASAKYDLGFLVAPLGKADNKKRFLQNQPAYPSFVNWEKPVEEQSALKSRITVLSGSLREVFSKQERLAQVRLELDSLQTEIRYFTQFCADNGYDYRGITPRRTPSSATLLRLWQECERYSEAQRAVSFWFKIRSAILYGISNWAFYANDPAAIVTLMQHLFYQTRAHELKNEIASLEAYLKDADSSGKMTELTELSMAYLRAVLYGRYGGQGPRTQLTEEDLWKHPEHVLEEYPITLSTTFMARGSLRGVTYDYIIMDEASQVDIATGALALSGARNAVIVGDLKQLPNVIKPATRKLCDEILARYRLPAGYSFSENSFLQSICAILPDAPQRLLREHYRCHPKIVDFCNQKFYRGELVIMTEDHGEPNVLSVYKTVPGNHRRGHMNQRQVDVISNEVLPTLNGTDPSGIGIIAPYRDQVETLVRQVGAEIETDTVHKFQGREKDTIILTTVDDVVTDFSDDPYLLNVAVSRAKNRLLLVVSGNEQPSGSNIGDLISYIEYNNFDVVQSKIYSVFDYLYRQYTSARIEFLRRHLRVSAYDSENLMYGMLVDVLAQYPNLSLDVVCHVPLRILLRDTEKLNAEEARYALHHNTHVDFLIYRRIGKTPVLAVEVDGFHNHKPGTAQYERDRQKDHILQMYDIPLLRFPTNGSGEAEKVTAFLEHYQS